MSQHKGTFPSMCAAAQPLGAAVFAGLFWGCVSASIPAAPTPPTPSEDDDRLALGTATVTGSVLDVDGLPISGLSVSLCGETCNIARSDDDGLFTFVEIPKGTKVIEPIIAHVEDGEELADAVRRWTRFFDFVAVADGEQLILSEPFTLYQVSEVLGPLTGPQELDLLADLHVAFDADEILEDGPLPPGATDIRLGATPIAQEHWPSRGLDDWVVLGAWGLAIWDLDAPDAFDVSVELPEPIDASAEVAFLVADYTYGFTEGRFWEEGAVLAPDGRTLTPPRTRDWIAPPCGLPSLAPSLETPHETRGPVPFPPPFRHRVHAHAGRHVLRR